MNMWKKLYKCWPLGAVLVLLSCQSNPTGRKSLTLAISPYQDIAMIVNAEPLGLDSAQNLDLDLVTMSWEDILPAVASAGHSVDVGFGSLTEYLTKSQEFNRDVTDSILFIYPAYVFKGGGFVTFLNSVPDLTKGSIQDTTSVKAFLSYRIGAQKESVYEMMLYTLAQRVGDPIDSLRIFDTPLNDGFLATSQGSLDISSAGLTQITETSKMGGRVVLTMESMGFADITGFICKQSTLNQKREEIEDLIRIWFECVAYVMADIDEHSKYSLAYLKSQASTDYTIEQYKNALSQEFFAESLAEADTVFLRANGKYSLERISTEINAYLTSSGIVKRATPAPKPILVTNKVD